MEKNKTGRKLIYIAILTLVIAFMDISGIPSALFVNVQIADIEPFYFTLMIKFLMIGMIAYLYLKILCPNWKLGLDKTEFADGLKEYGVTGVIIALVGFATFYVGLMPFDRQPSVAKVLVEGVIYYVGVAIIDPCLRKAVEELGTWIGNSGNALIYGGSKSGLMGAIADSVLKVGGEITGVEPNFFIENEFQHDGLTKLIVTKDIFSTT